MIRIEQVRGEMLERFERFDRRFAQMEQRLARIDQRLGDLADQVDWLRRLLERQLQVLSGLPADPIVYECACDDGDEGMEGAESTGP